MLYFLWVGNVAESNKGNTCKVIHVYLWLQCEVCADMYCMYASKHSGSGAMQTVILPLSFGQF